MNKLSTKLIFLLLFALDIGQSVFGYTKYKDNLFLYIGIAEVIVFVVLYSLLMRKDA
jgi:hypothetical protein